jgi:hypothetical protein
VDAQIQNRFDTGSIEHRVIVAFDHESEDFRARDVNSGGATNQDRDRSHSAVTAEWRADAGPVAADVALRRDVFNRFKDSTTLRASLLADVGAGFSLAASYGEGIAQPTFFDLYGFFPNSFVGNPLLKPEHSRGMEASVRYRRETLSVALTAYRQRLRDEIVDIFDPSTFLSSTVNRSEKSRRPESKRKSAGTWPIAPPDGQLRLSECHRARRRPRSPPPRHSGSVSADGELGRLTYGVSLAYTGDRIDTDFESFPFRRVTLDSYWLAGARIAFNVADRFSCSRGQPTRSTRTIRTRSAIGLKGGASMSASALLAAASIASLNLCTDEYLLLLARPQEIASISFLSQNPLESPLWKLAKRHHSNRGSLEQVLGRSPTPSLPWVAAGAPRRSSPGAFECAQSTCVQSPRSMTLRST